MSYVWSERLAGRNCFWYVSKTRRDKRSTENCHINTHDELARYYIWIYHSDGHSDVQEGKTGDRDKKERSFSSYFLNVYQTNDYEEELDGVDDDWGIFTERFIDRSDKETALCGDGVTSCKMPDNREMNSQPVSFVFLLVES